MTILGLILEIRFRNKTKLVQDDRRQNIHALISGNQPENPPPDTSAGMNMINTAQRTNVVVEEGRIAIQIEGTDHQVIQRRTLEVLGILYDQADYKDNKIVRIGVRTKWIGTWDQSFAKLYERYKEVFYNDNSILDRSVDIAVNLTLEDNGYRVNFISGPMKPEEGLSQVLFKDRDFPHDFIFVDIDRFDISGSYSNTLASIKRFFNESVKYGKDISEDVYDLLTV